MAQEVTKDDLNRVYDKMEAYQKDFYQALTKASEESRLADDRLRGEIQDLIKVVTSMKQQLEDRPRPCSEVELAEDKIDGHLKSHEHNSEALKSMGYRIAAGLAVAGIVAICGAAFAAYKYFPQMLH